MISKTMILAICLFFGSTGHQPDAFKEKREEMVRSQLISRGISSPEVLEAFRNVPRHVFVPAEYLQLAYADQPLPIGEGQTISQPYIVAYMTEILDIKPGEKVLEIGTGSGYQAAILKQVGAEVFSVEVIGSLSERADKILKNIGISDIHLKIADGYLGWPEFAPFDAIVVTCSPSEIPSPLVLQLAEGGKMIIPVGEQHSVQFLYLLEKKEGKIRQKNVLPVRFVPMVDDKGRNH
jgi:protein-L-isoaspartate(D-aspartate) O-methyltransferase